MPRVRRALLAVALATFLCGCPRAESTAEVREADRLQALAEKTPSPAAYEALLHAILMAARTHENVHDAVGVGFQIRAQETQVRLAELVTDPAERSRLAYEVIDRVDDLERGDVLRVYEDVLPGSAERMRAVRSKAKTLTN